MQSCFKTYLQNVLLIKEHTLFFIPLICQEIERACTVNNHYSFCLQIKKSYDLHTQKISRDNIHFQCKNGLPTKCIYHLKR